MRNKAIALLSIMSILTVGIFIWAFSPKDRTQNLDLEKKPPITQEQKAIEAAKKKNGNELPVAPKKTDKIDKSQVEEVDIGKSPVNKIKGDIEGITGFTKEEVGEALEFSTSYTISSMTDKYFVGGDWAKNGFKESELKDKASKWFTSGNLKTLDNLDKYEGAEFREKVLPFTIYYTDNDEITVSPKCAVETINDVIDSGCQVTPVVFDNIQYQESADKKAVDIYFDASYNLAAIIKDGNKDAQMNIKNSTGLRVVKIADEVDSTKNRYAIDGYRITTTFSKVTEVTK